MELDKLGYLEPGMVVRINGKVVKVKEEFNVYGEATKWRWNEATGDYSGFVDALLAGNALEVTNARIVGSSILDYEGNEIRDYRVNAESPSVFVFETTLRGLEELVKIMSVLEVNAFVTHYNETEWHDKFRESVIAYREGSVSVTELKDSLELKELVKSLDEFKVHYTNMEEE